MGCVAIIMSVQSMHKPCWWLGVHVDLASDAECSNENISLQNIFLLFLTGSHIFRYLVLLHCVCVCVCVCACVRARVC